MRPVKPPLEGYTVKNMKRKVQKGFTLIELMIVIAIVAILVALAVPAYQDYAIRAKVGECIGQGASAKLAIEEYFQSEGSLPTASQSGYDTGDFTATTYCVTMVWGGTLLTLTTQATGATTAPVITLTPTVSGDRITGWVCVNTAGEDRHVPASCRGT